MVILLVLFLGFSQTKAKLGFFWPPSFLGNWRIYDKRDWSVARPLGNRNPRKLRRYTKVRKTIWLWVKNTGYLKKRFAKIRKNRPIHLWSPFGLASFWPQLAILGENLFAFARKPWSPRKTSDARSELLIQIGKCLLPQGLTFFDFFLVGFPTKND